MLVDIGDIGDGTGKLCDIFVERGFLYLSGGAYIVSYGVYIYVCVCKIDERERERQSDDLIVEL
jgi:hypothetical protein